MYADRLNRTGGLNPGSLGVALAVNGVDDAIEPAGPPTARGAEIDPGLFQRRHPGDNCPDQHD